MSRVEELVAEFERVNAEAGHVAPALLPVLRSIEQAIVENRREIERITHA